MERWLPKVFLALLGPIYLIYLFAPAFGQFHDDGIYLSTSHALASGKGYLHESLPVSVPQTKYPFLYPALLAPLWFASQSPFTVAFLAKILSLGALAAWMLATRGLIRHWLPNEEVLDWICFFSLAAPWALYVSTSALPDTLFALLCTLCLTLLLSVEPATGRRRLLLLLALAVFAAAAFLIRTTGLAVILAVSVFLLRRRIKDGLLFLASCGLLCAPWLIWQASQSAPLDSVQLYYSKLSYAKGQILSGYSLDQVLGVVLYNATMLMTQFLVWAPAIPFGLALLAGLALAGIAIVGAFRSLRHGEGLALWASFYTGILLCWIWPPFRYAVPALPLYLLLFVLGFAPWIHGRLRPQLARLAVVLIACVALLANVAGAKRTLELGTTVVGWADADEWKPNLEILQWIRANTPESAVFAANLDPMVFLVTGRKAIKPFEHLQYALYYAGENGPSSVGTPAEILQHFQRNGITHVLISPMRNFREKRSFDPAFAQLLRDYPRAFQKLKEIPGSGYAVYAIERAELPAPAQNSTDRSFTSSARSTAPSSASN